MAWLRFLSYVVLLVPVTALTTASTSTDAATPSSTPTLTPEAAFALLPECATDCIVSAASAHGCVATNLTCLCASPGLEEQATWCIRGSCTALQTLYAKNTTAQICNVPVRDKSRRYIATSDTLGIVTGLLVLLRMGQRLLLLRRAPSSSASAPLYFHADDWLCLATTLFGVPSTVLNVYGLAATGLGRDVWTLPPPQVYRFIRFLYVMEVQYYVDVSLLKITLLLFYMRIFSFPGVRRVLWTTVAFVVVFGVLFTGLAVFQCTPVSYYWTRWDGLHEGHCLNINAIAWANAATSIAVDLWMLAIPLWQLRSLRLHWKKKIGASLMFCVGTFVTVVSILRLQSLLDFANSINPTWDNYNVTQWSTIEINVGIVCACMPSLRLLLVHFFPKIVGSSESRDRHGYDMNTI